MTAPETAPPTVTTQVVVVGAGPVGLMLAGELRRAGVAVVVVERLARPMTESRASQLTALTAELLHERGLDDLLDEAVHEPRAHFGGLPVDLTGLDSRYAGNWKVPQYRTEAVLGARAERLGAVLLRAHELTGIAEFDDHVVGRVDGPAGRTGIRARYLVGCDGVGSEVRRLCGLGVAVTDPTRELLRADVAGLDIPDRRFERLPDGLAVAATRAGVTRVMVHVRGQDVPRRTRPPEFAEVARAWARVTGEDIRSGQPLWLDSFDNASGLATRFRRGRVLLAGDAAHWHLPIGGQALNVGLQDAVNLGWKLAGSVRGWAPPGLLDSYHDERHPAAAAVLDSVVAQETLLLGGSEVEPLRAVLAELLQLDRAGEQVARVASGLATCYRGGAHPLVGRRIPTAEFWTGSGVVTAADLTRGGPGAVILRIVGPDGLDVDGLDVDSHDANGEDANGQDANGQDANGADPDGADPTGAADAAARAGRAPVRTVRLEPVRPGALDNARLILMRPDGYVAWAGTDRVAFASAFRQWFGTPVGAPYAGAGAGAGAGPGGVGGPGPAAFNRGGTAVERTR